LSRKQVTFTAGADKAHDTADHVANLPAMNLTARVTQNNSVITTGSKIRKSVGVA
jgi:hypothetical protein